MSARSVEFQMRAIAATPFPGGALTGHQWDACLLIRGISGQSRSVYE